MAPTGPKYEVSVTAAAIVTEPSRRVVIEIHRVRTRTPVSIREARFGCYILETAVPQIAIEVQASGAGRRNTPCKEQPVCQEWLLS